MNLSRHVFERKMPSCVNWYCGIFKERDQKHKKTDESGEATYDFVLI